MGLNAQKRFRQGQILKLITSEPISSQDELRKRLSHVKVRVTQATLSRDMSELKLVKTTDGYKPLGTATKSRPRCRRWAARCGIIWSICAPRSICSC